MSIDMTKWQEIAKANIHKRPAGAGRLAGKITIVTGAASAGLDIASLNVSPRRILVRIVLTFMPHSSAH